MRGHLQRGRSIQWSWASRIDNEPGIVHAADCQGFTIRRGSRPTTEGWCEHENPPHSKPATASDGDAGLHDGLPSEVPAEVKLPQLPELPVAIPSGLPIEGVAAPRPDMPATAVPLNKVVGGVGAASGGL